MIDNCQKVFLLTTGCLTLRLDTARIEAYLLQNNYEIVNTPEAADIILITTCVATALKEQLCINYIERLDEDKKRKVVIAGCGAVALPQHFGKYTVLKDEKDMESYFPPLRVRFSSIVWNGAPHDFGYVPPNVRTSIKHYCIFERILRQIDEELGSSFKYGTTGFEFSEASSSCYRIAIAKGCSFRCSYCIVPKARGTYESVPIDLVLSQINEGYSRGNREFLLVADEVSSYGIDIGGKFLLGDLLQAIQSRFPDIRIALRYLEPMGIDRIWDEIKAYINDAQVLYFNIPLQSGSEKILKKINRSSTRLDSLCEILTEIRGRFKGPILTHAIVGFPYENTDDIARTCDYLISAGFDDVSIQNFSPRPGTKDENCKLHDNWRDHRHALEECRKYLRTRYLMRRLSYQQHPMNKATFQTEVEFRFAIDTLPADFREYLNLKKWNKESIEIDIVLMHEKFEGFVARIRKSRNIYLQFKIQQQLRVWNEISTQIERDEVHSVFKTLSEFLDPLVAVIKKRKLVKVNGEITLFIDEVDTLGTYVEIEGKNESVGRFMQRFAIAPESSAEPYGKLILQNSPDLKGSMRYALSQILKS